MGGASELRLEGEARLASQSVSSGSGVLGSTRTDVRHLRISTVGNHRQLMENGVTVSPSLSMGLREDGKHDLSFLGMELVGGINLANPNGYEVSTKGDLLLAGTDRIREKGMSGKLPYDFGSNGLGVLLDIAPAWGWSMPVAENAMWGNRVLVRDFDSCMHTGGARINMKIGYGFSVWENLGILKPYGGFLLSKTQDETFRMGNRLDLDQDMEFGLEGVQICE